MACDGKHLLHHTGLWIVNAEVPKRVTEHRNELLICLLQNTWLIFSRSYLLDFFEGIESSVPRAKLIFEKYGDITSFSLKETNGVGDAF